jgi:hypothetical protein
MPAVPALVFIDGNDLRAAEVKQILGVELVVEALTSGFATAAPEPEHKARDKVLAHPTTGACFAEAVDLTKDGNSLRLELDSENDNRFCKWWRETPVTMELRVALRGTDGAVRVFAASCPGRIADRPAGPQILGWDRLFVPDGDDVSTLAEQCARGEPSALRLAAYRALAAALGVVTA